MSETSPKMITAIKIGCQTSGAHLTCSYPDCTCKTIPAAVKAAVEFAIRDAAFDFMRGVKEMRGV